MDHSRDLGQQTGESKYAPSVLSLEWPLEDLTAFDSSPPAPLAQESTPGSSKGRREHLWPIVGPNEERANQATIPCPGQEAPPSDN